MLIFPAIDLMNGEAVRLYKGDYDKKTVYSTDPITVAKDFENCGAECIHLVDLEGAKSGDTPNLKTVTEIKKNTSLFAEVGGGIRNMDVVDRYIGEGLDRVILGTAAVTDETFLLNAVEKYGEKIAVGIDIKDGFVAIKGWTEKSELTAYDFMEKMQNIGVKTVICTDISRDGAMKGTNISLYKNLTERFSLNLIASGGVSDIDDITALKSMGMYGAIIGKAYYIGAIDLKKAVETAK